MNSLVRRIRNKTISWKTSLLRGASYSTQRDESYDVVIAGGGIVGTTLAVALGQAGRLSDKKILLLESAPKFSTKDTVADGIADYSNRVVALSPGSVKYLKKLGIWKDVWRVQEVSCLQVWDGLSDAHISFHNPEYQEPVAYIVENPVLTHAVAKGLKEVSNVRVEFGSSLKECEIPPANQPDEKVVIDLKDGGKLSTELLVGADGFNSIVRSTMGSPYLGFNYGRNAVVATLKLNEPTDNRAAWQRFVPTGGPIAMLPLSNEHSSLVWSSTPEFAKKLVEMPCDEFVDAWHEHPKAELVKKSCELLSAFNILKPGPRIYPPSVSEVIDKSRAMFPLGFGHAAYYVTRRTALIGDAAHRVHPLAGQGLNLGLGDVECLHKIIDDTAGIGGDIGNIDVLKYYETERQRHNVAIQGGIDFLHRLYSVDFTPIVALRTVGLSMVNSSEMLKRAIMSQAAA